MIDGYPTTGDINRVMVNIREHGRDSLNRETHQVFVIIAFPFTAYTDYMAPQSSRRALLQSVGAGVIAGLAGCGSNGGTDTTTTASPTTYDIELRNQLTAEHFQDSEYFDAPQPAVIYVRVNNVDPNSDTTYFEQTVEVPTNSSKTLTDTFTVEPDGPIYAIAVELEPFTEDGISKPRNRKDGASFAPENRPQRNPIPVILRHADTPRPYALYPNIYIAI